MLGALLDGSLIAIQCSSRGGGLFKGEANLRVYSILSLNIIHILQLHEFFCIGFVSYF